MNIMLATVTERTVEIGVRRALGAKRRDIVQQFLVETVLLAIVGGVTGILGGFACGPMIRWLRTGLERVFPHVIENLPDVVRTATPVVVPWSIPLAFAISIAVGIFFGLYPALRAARLDPIEALRHQ
jgi:ABC-type antimicrobial peptide transport system permease subunit